MINSKDDLTFVQNKRLEETNRMMPSSSNTAVVS